MNKHNIMVSLDYRVAHTIIQGMKQWLEKLENMLDESAASAGKDIPCRRTNGNDRRSAKERREHTPEEDY